MELEEQVMGIIINAGQSRSLCYEALGCAKKVTLKPQMNE
jgi:PTS system cellobiose-specific IIA component